MTAPRAKTTALARQILEIARRDGLAAGTHLPEVKLAERLGVSRSPVRAALALLKDRGAVELAALESARGQGYFLALDSDGPAFAAVTLPEPEEAVIYRDLVRARFANLIPPQIAVSDVMRRCDCDRATANRVLAQMSEDGVIERAPGRGYLFGPVLNDAQAYEESYRFRLLVEPAAVLEPGFRPDPKRMRRLRKRHEELLAAGIETLPMAELFEADAEFHEAIGDFCGNRFLAHAIRLQTRLRRLSEYENYSDRARLSDSCREHLAILDALEAGETERAARLLRRHIEVSEAVRPNFDKVRALAHRRLTRV